MKKLVTLLLSLALVLSLAACGGEATPDASDDAPASSQNEESTENDNTENQIVFEEVVAIDNAECAVKITEIDPDNMWGYTLKAQLENKSTEKTYMFSVESASINGVQCDPMFASEVAAGKKANEEINFSTDTLEENGIVESLRGESAFSQDLLGSLISDCETKCLEVQHTMEAAQAAYDEGQAMLDALNAQYDDIISWADMYDSASTESKKMIVSCLIRRVEVYRDYRLHIDFNIDFEQFSAGLDISAIAA